MNSETYLTNRLLAALMASCLLHAAVIAAPYFGSSPTVDRAAGAASGPGRSLRAKLVTASAPAAAVAETPALPASPAESQARRAADGDRGAAEHVLAQSLLPIPAPAFYTTDQLTTRPQPTSQPRLLTPEMGPSLPSGKVILKLWITEFGHVASVEVEKSELPAAVTAMAAAEFGKLRFVPGQRNGRPVGAMMRIEVVYFDGAALPP